ncbi:MAG: beta-ketoacyl synthase N-terminal-like domain-containing protein [Candidatus Binatia bacterium]
MREAIVVTGVGVVSPLGPLPAFWSGLCAGTSGISRSTPQDGVLTEPGLEARVRDWQARDHIRSALLRRMDHTSRMVVSACRMALTDAALVLEGARAEDAGIVVGTAFGNLSESEDFLRGLFAKGPGLANPLTFPNLVMNAPTGYVAIDLGIRGPNLTVVRGEASGEAALALAFDTIAAGHADVLLAGGVDELTPVARDVYVDLALLSPGENGGEEWSSPFDRGRNGYVMGEGAAMLVLELASHAESRGARIYAELAGYATENIPASPHDWPTVAAGAASGRATAEQLTALGMRPVADRDDGGGITLVVSCANSTRRLDAVEAARLTTLLGMEARRALVTSLKGSIGELGAAGALGAAAAVQAIATGDVPRLGALRHPDPACTFPLATRSTPKPTGGVAEVLLSATPRGGGAITVLLRRP